MKKKIICCVAGHSVGHIIPCLPLAQQANSDKSTTYLFFSSKKNLDSTILNSYDLDKKHITINLMNIPHKKLWQMPLFIMQFIYECTKSIGIFLKHRPEKIISTGGYISIPVCLAGKLLGIKIELYELNVAPGKAITFLSRFTPHIFICFNKTSKFFKKPTTLIPYPIRFSGEKNNQNTKNSPFTEYVPSKKTILVLGGSQGSDFLNHQICQLISLYGSDIQIIHQTGHAHLEILTAFYKSLHLNAVVFAYQPDLAPYYHIADLVICRSGAGTLFETIFFKKPYITIPLETSTTDHQVDNAYALHNEYPKLSNVIRQKELEIDQLLLFKTVSNCFEELN